MPCGRWSHLYRCTLSVINGFFSTTSLGESYMAFNKSATQDIRNDIICVCASHHAAAQFLLQILTFVSQHKR